MAKNANRRSAVPYPLVYVEWVDSSHLGTGWNYLDDFPAGDDQALCVSVGFLVRKTRRSIVLVPNMADVCGENLQVHGSILIPTRAITRQTVLRPGA